MHVPHVPDPNRERNMDEILQELQRDNAKLKAERDLWHARAMAMFWRLPDDTKCGDLRADAEKALAMFRS